MATLQLGPLALPARVLVPLGAMLVSLAVSRWGWRERHSEVEPLLWKMLVGALLAARLAYVVAYFDMYASAPWSMLDIRDGGFVATAGMLAALALGAQLTARTPQLRRPLLVSALAGAIVWVAGVVASRDFNPVPKPMPDITLTRLDGSPFALRSLAGKPLVVNLWASWCGPCRREMPVLRDAQARYKDVVFVFANQGEDAQSVRSYLEGEGLVLENVLLDPGFELGKKTASSALPTTLFFNREAMLVTRRIGELSAATLAERIGAVKNPTTK